MRIESFSIKQITISIFLMIGLAAIVLSLFAGGYFRQAALDAQIKSLSRVIEVATDEKLKEVKQNTFDLGMRLSNNAELIKKIKNSAPQSKESIVVLLDDPFVNGFVGFSNINLQKIRIFDMELQLVAESSKGMKGLDVALPAYLQQELKQRHGVDRLKAIDSLWLSYDKPLFSTLVPMGGLHLIGYVEVVIDPILNLADIGKITQTPVSVFSAKGEAVKLTDQDVRSYLPIDYTLLTTSGEQAFRLVGYENVDNLNREMQNTQVVTTSGFLLLTLSVLLSALWLFHYFLLQPMKQMIVNMKKIAGGQLDLDIDKKGLKEFSILAAAFNAMADQIRLRTNELHDSQDRLLHLLDLDNSAILCFGSVNDMVYFNKGASEFFGYTQDEMYDLEFSELFTDDITQLTNELEKPGTLHLPLECIAKAGRLFKSDAVISTLSAMGESGYAVVLGSMSRQPIAKEALPVETQDIKEVEQSLKRILEIASNNPGLLLGGEGDASAETLRDKSANDKVVLREQVVNVMNASLECWEHELGKSKLALAEESKIWPVYIDKSTPTTRTLDKYLQIDSCPQNPRCQRVIDTAEFVLKHIPEQQQTACQGRLVDSLETLRQSISGT